MDYKFLDKVIDQLVRETEIHTEFGRIYTPISSTPLRHPFPFSSPLFSFSSPFFFSKHCRDIYGLNDDEIEYVWKEYRETIIDKINNG
jgi:hypothetical protein